jgi:hypothetical protein
MTLSPRSRNDWLLGHFFPKVICIDSIFILYAVHEGSFDRFSISGTENAEPIQVLRYEIGQKYDAHFDYFRDTVNLRFGGQRVATVLMYLTDVKRGGETVFPYAEVWSRIFDLPFFIAFSLIFIVFSFLLLFPLFFSVFYWVSSLTYPTCLD